MSSTAHDDERRIIPRWRSLRSSIARGELGVRADAEPARDPAEFAKYSAAFIQTPSLGSAGDLLACAVVLGKESESIVKKAANVVLRQGNADAPAASIAKAMLGMPIAGNVGSLADTTNLRARIAIRKAALRRDPRNAIVLAEMARDYCVLGQNTSAAKCFDMALRLVDSHRYVVRSASRFYCHIGDHDLAKNAIMRAKLRMSDPWLLAADLAVTAIMGASPHSLKHARQMAKGGRHSAYDVSELSAAIAFFDFRDGSARSARQLFRQSLQAPTENAVAQACWAQRHGLGLEIENDVLHEQDCWEGQAWNALGAGQAVAALDSCDSWLGDEPFSHKPAELGSFVAVVSGQDLPRGESFARRGLQANPGRSVLINNLAVALAQQGKTSEAEKLLDTVGRHGVDSRLGVTLMATRGLIEYRKGNPLVGSALYEQAARAATGIDKHVLEPMVRLHHLLEVWRSERSASSLLQIATKSSQSTDPGLRLASLHAMQLAAQDNA